MAEIFLYSMLMRVCVNLNLPGFEDALAKMLPHGLRVQGCELDEDILCISCCAPMLPKIQLRAKVCMQEGGMRLQSFQLKGAGLANAILLEQVRKRIASLDLRTDLLHLWGDSDGSTAYLSWVS